jgi:hypothetical protein
VTLRRLRCAAMLVLAGLAAATTSASASALPIACPRAPRPSSAAGPESESGAQADAASLLAVLSLGPGSSESSSEPSGDDSLLARPGEDWAATPNGVDEHAWWLVALAPAEALAYLCGHLPPGTATASYGGGLKGPGMPENEVDAFAVSGIPGTLVIQLVRLPNGSTALRADGQVVWITPRPTSEKIPSGARMLRITVHDRHDRPSESESEPLALLERLPWMVTSVGRIEAIVALLNKLDVIQPGLRLCPFGRGGDVELTFYASPDSAPLAAADIATEGCGGVSLMLGGVPQPGLEGGSGVVSQIGEVLGVNPAAGPPVGLTPHISRVRMSRARFAAPVEDVVTLGVEPGTEFLFDLSAPAEVSIAISRLPRGTHFVDTCVANAERPRRLRAKHCQRTVTLARFTRLTEPEGQDGIAFSGIVGRRALASGRYLAVLSALNTSGSSRVGNVEFEIVR